MYKYIHVCVGAYVCIFCTYMCACACVCCIQLFNSIILVCAHNNTQASCKIIY